MSIDLSVLTPECFHDNPQSDRDFKKGTLNSSRSLKTQSIFLFRESISPIRTRINFVLSRARAQSFRGRYSNVIFVNNHFEGQANLNFSSSYQYETNYLLQRSIIWRSTPFALPIGLQHGFPASCTGFL
jgi:hypothetical protein